MSRITTLLAAGLASGLAIAAPAFAHGYKVGALEIEHPWARATPPSAKVGAGYFSIRNTGSTPDRLVAVGATVSDNVQMHEMAVDNGVATMRPVTGGVEIKPGQTVTFKPGGFHVMFTGLKEPLKKGDTVHGSLTFEKAGKVDVDFAVQDVGAPAPQHEHMSQ